MREIDFDLLNACKLGKLTLVKELIQKGADPRAKNLHGDTPLHFAAFWGHGDIVDHLISLGAYPFVTNNIGDMPIDKAVQTERENLADYLRYQANVPANRKKYFSYDQEIEVEKEKCVKDSITTAASVGLDPNFTPSSIQSMEALVSDAVLKWFVKPVIIGITAQIGAQLQCSNYRLLFRNRINANQAYALFKQNIPDTIIHRLHRAASEGDLTELKKIISSGINPSLEDGDGNTLLHFAAYGGYKDVVQFAIDELKLNPHKTNHQGETTFHKAGKKADFMTMKYLVEEHDGLVGIYRKNNLGQSPLELITYSADLTLIEYLIEKQTYQAKNTFTNAEQISYLGYLGRGEKSKWENSKEKKDQGEEKWGSLEPTIKYYHLAESLGDKEAEKQLAWLYYDNNLCLLHYAIKKGELDIAQSIILNDASKTAMNQSCKIPSDVNWFTQLYNNIDTRESSWTPSHFAVMYDRIDILNLLAKVGANIDVPDDNLRSPLLLAAQENKIRAAVILMRSGADIHKQDRNHDTALIIAARGKNLEFCAFLIHLGANQRVRNLRNEDYFNLTTEKERYLDIGKRVAELAEYHRDIARPHQILARITTANGGNFDLNLETIYKNLLGQDSLAPLLNIAAIAGLGLHHLSNQDIRDHFRIRIDPTSELTDNLGGTKNSLGIYRQNSNMILVGGKGKKEQVRGTLVHEITHFIAHEVYNYYALPFFKNDKTNEKRFMDIVKNLHSRYLGRESLPPIIGDHLFPRYEAFQYAQELIVRVPQIYARANASEIEILKEKAPELVSYYHDVFLKDCERHYENLKDNILFIRNFDSIDPNAILSRAIFEENPEEIPIVCVEGICAETNIMNEHIPLYSQSENNIATVTDLTEAQTNAGSSLSIPILIMGSASLKKLWEEWSHSYELIIFRASLSTEEPSFFKSISSEEPISRELSISSAPFLKNEQSLANETSGLKIQEISESDNLIVPFGFVNQFTEKNIIYSYGKWDDTIEKDAFSGQPIFIYRIYNIKDQEIGKAKFLGTPSFCRSEDATRDNLLETTGVLQQLPLKQTRQFLPDICSVLPPTLLERVLKTTSVAAKHGFLRGTSRIIDFSLQQRGCSRLVSHSVSQVCYYSSIGLLRFSEYYVQLEIEDEFTRFSRAILLAAYDTGSIFMINMALMIINLCLTVMSEMAEKNQWKKVGKTLRRASSLISYGIFAYHATHQGVLETTAALSVGAASELLTEKMGTTAARYFM